MKKQSWKRIAAVLLILLLAVPLTGCEYKSIQANKRYNKYGSNAGFVKNIARTVTWRQDTPDQFYAGGNEYVDLTADPVFQPYFAMLDFKATRDRDNPEIVHYSCRIPGLVGSCANSVFGVCINANEEYSPWVTVEGDVRIVRDENGKRQIDISKADNVFAAYAALRYPDHSLFTERGVDLTEGLADGDRQTAMGILLGTGSVPYANLTGTTAEDYISDVITPELTVYQENASTLLSKTNKAGYGKVNKYNALPAILRVPLDIILVLLCLILISIPIIFIVNFIINAIDNNELKKKWKKYCSAGGVRVNIPKGTLKGALQTKDKTIQVRAIQAIPLPEGKELLAFLAEEADGDAFNAAYERLSYPEHKDILIRLADNNRNYSKGEKAVRKLPYPEEREILARLAKEGGRHVLRAAALEKLPYPEEREAVEAVLKEGVTKETREMALGMLTFPESKDALVDFILDKNADGDLRLAAVKKIPYPQERELLTDIAINTLASSSVEADILERLRFPKDRKELARIGKGIGGYSPNYSTLLKKLPYPEARKELIDIALHATSDYNRYRAMEVLPYPEERDTLLAIAKNDKDPDNRKKALSRLSDEQEDQALLSLIAMNDGDSDMRREAIEKLVYPESREALVYAAEKDEDEDNRRIARDMLPFLEEPDGFIREIESGSATNNDRIKGAIALAFHPRRSEKILRFLCTSIQAGMKPDASKKVLTIGGWSAAALGRILAKEMKPDDIAKNEKRMEKAIDKYNKFVGEALDIQKELRPYEGRSMSSLAAYERNMIDRNMSRLKKINGQLDRGLGNMMLDNGDLPLAYLTHILRDNQTRVPRFVKQGVIMGLVDWLSANSSHTDAKKLLENVVAVRADIIRSDNDLSFYEVRVPSECSKKEYAAILKDVLHCTNPSIKFCDTEKLIEIADAEVPGCMRMLCECPLRIIDPVNSKTLGFYKFDPYIHAMWVQYQPPKDTGKVISRYHEVDDRTRPLSSGLNLGLFRDPWSVIPTIFHEYQHFKGDRNEASVFLKTQMFSIGFYKQYPQASAKSDAVFARLTTLLGMPPAPSKREDLNALIKEYYGEQHTQAEAVKHADEELARLNGMIMVVNMQQKWDPQVRFPRFTDDEDSKDMKLIRDIIIRYDTVPKSITDKEFRSIAG